MSFFNKRNLFILGFILVLLIAIPLTVYVSQKQQQTQSNAVKSTVLSFSPPSSQSAPIQKTTDDTVNLDVILNPGTNQVNFVKLEITYDSTKLATASGTCGETFCPNPASLTPLSKSFDNGKIVVTLNNGLDPSRLVQTEMKIGTITLKPVAATTAPVLISFSAQNIVKSIANPDQPSENVLSTTSPAWISIAQGSETIISPTAATSPVPTGPETSQTPNEPPICTALNLDREATGTAPFSLTFTAIGNDPDGKLNKATFNFGDGPVQDVLQGGGLGTNNASVQISHTYNNPGTFQASAIFTDDRAGISDQTTCAKTLTISQGEQVIVPTSPQAQIETPTTAVLSPIPTSGPGQTILGIGAAGLILSIIGGLLIFAL